MAGRPMLRRMQAAVERCALEDGCVREDGTPDGDTWIAEFLADGWSTRRLTEHLVPRIGFDFSRPFLQAYLKATPERKAMVDEARKFSASALAEDAGDVLEDLAKKDFLQAADVSLAKERSAFRRWLAAKRDPEQYGDRQAGVELHLHVGDLHLQALQAVGRKGMVPVAAREERALPVVEAEVISITDGGGLPEELEELK